MKYSRPMVRPAASPRQGRDGASDRDRLSPVADRASRAAYGRRSGASACPSKILALFFFI